MFILLRGIRDNTGTPHKPGEVIQVVTATKRAQFDDRTMYTVQFSNGARGAVFQEEIEENV